ncbi:hypothetical protein ACFQI7_07725 [Paenibacillus allorhizosphaerae]|uniref:Uncharacterized protein n=1 Tax=Paenibacillus allorhizosphaerae TaxID=2849866 RepID=A0ABM8VGA1_9BACL|nr:hypothetical protein [Paenibacillus allorhizosphaerae]CAG7637476.1 hypothetical protein PAECIP111802_02362 [Paenibacillus allorhizosphaerae]
MVRIQFQDLRVETVSGSSGIFSGSNSQHKFKHAAKQNQAFGTISGESCIVSDVQASLDDRDRIDMHNAGKPSPR